MKKAYNKSIFREFKSSITRFLSILAIIFLGVAFYTGIRATGPNMVNTAQNFFDQSELFELRIVSTYGLNQKDVDLASSDESVLDVQTAYSMDVLQLQENQVVKVMSYDRSSSMNQPYLVEGQLPSNNNEIALDTNMKSEYSIGDDYTLTLNEDNKDKLKLNTFKIVGFANSPMYLENIHRGYTNIGKGTINSIVFLDQDVFNMDVYTDMYLRFKDMESVKAYSDTYDSHMDENEFHIKNLFINRPQERLAEVKQEPLDKLNKAKVDLDSGSKEWNEGKLKLEQGQSEYSTSLNEWNNGYLNYLNEMQTSYDTLTSGQVEIDTNRNLLDDASTLLSNGKLELDQAKKQLDDALKTFTALGIDPSDSTESLELSQEALQYVLDNYDSLEELIPYINVDDLKQASAYIRTIISSNDELAYLLPYLDQFDQALEDPNFIANLPEFIANSKDELMGLNTQLKDLIQGIQDYNIGLPIYNENYNEWLNSYTQLTNSYQELELAQNKINDGWIAYNSSKITMDDFFNSSKNELNSALALLNDGQRELDENKISLDDGLREYGEGVKELNQLETPDYYYFGRESYPGYTQFYQNTLRVSSIADVIPIFFFSIAALISLTTMTRMVEEKRSEIGTLKGLGYTNKEISKKFLVYAGLATTIGVILGVLFGSYVFPTLIYNAYRALYSIQELVVEFQPIYIIQSVIFSFVCTMGSTYAVLRSNLKATPAILMIPKAPKLGKKILLEKITPIWKRLSFSMKVTFRNVFRYKQRMIMTIIGIAGCTALMMIGFGLKDSINDVSKKQFDNIWLYDAQITYKDEYSDNQKEEFDTLFQQTDAFGSQLLTYQTSFEASYNNNSLSATVVVPKSSEEFSNYVHLNNRVSGKQQELNDDGVYISEKAAKLLQLRVGDELTLKKEGQEYQVPIVGISENYVAHFIYMTPTYYTSHINPSIIYNSSYVLMNENELDQDQIALDLMNTGVISNITFMSSTLGDTMDAMKSINMVVIILIVSAGLLALIVLYNLSNINVSERIRELSTIKVLGFYDNEVTRYVYRENIILSILGIAIGFILGIFLHKFVITVAEIDELMFSQNIHILSYVLSGILTMFFTIIVLIIMHGKLKKINMIDALKSND